VHWNSELYALTGVERGEQTPSLNVFLETVHPADRKRLVHKIRRTMQTGRAFEVQSRHRLPGGGYRTVISRGQPIRDDDGNVVEIYGTIHDITQQVAEVDRIQAQTTAMQQLIDWSAEPICAIDPSGTVLAASSALGQQLGVPASELRCNWSLEIDTSQASTSADEGPQSVFGRFCQVGQQPQSLRCFTLHRTDCDKVRIVKLV
jgi:PAS domain S-box-containing protein